MAQGIDNSIIEKKVRELLAEKTGYPLQKISADSVLRDDLGIDSFATIEIAFAIDHEFGVKVAQEDLVKFQTVRDICDKITRTL